MSYDQAMKTNELFCYLIDDDADDREFFASAIKQLDENIRLETASGANEALNDLHQKKQEIPNYIFLDLNMAPVDGKECLTRIKNTSHLADVPVIIYSTKLDEKLVYDTLQMGAFDHIEKPSKADTLVRYLKRVLQRAY
jgi:DNA-binding NtrC family response regulator